MNGGARTVRAAKRPRESRSSTGSPRKPYLMGPLDRRRDRMPDSLFSIEKEIVDHYFVLRPTQAAGLGLHEYDGVLPDLSASGTSRWSNTARELLVRLKSVPDPELTAARRFDRTLLHLLLDGALFDLEESRELDRNPMAHLFVPDLTNYLIRDYAPIETRMQGVNHVLEGVPRLLENAKARLDRVLPRPFVSLSIQIASGLPAHFAEAEALAAKHSAALRSQVGASKEVADQAVLTFGEWLKTDRLPHANDDFALGRVRFQRLLWVREGLSTAVDEVLRRGRADLKRNQDRLNEIARREGVPPDRLFARLNDDHPAEEELIPLTQRLTEQVKGFIQREDLVSVPEPAICHVRETPEWARELWTAAMSPPGPFEKPVDGIYWVTTANPTWKPSEKDGWLRTLNFAMLKNTTVHEVWPGHYLQALHSRKAEQSLARRVWFSYSFCEGWAHYCEQAALEAGLDDRSTNAEVTQLRDALLRDSRLIVSIGMHTQGMSIAEATHLLRTEAHLEEIHAQREAIRGTYNPEYFCYTLGKLAILDARTKYLEPRFHASIKAFHDSVLSFGTPPIGLLDGLLAER